MDARQGWKKGLVGIFVILTGACGTAEPPGGVNVWIDVPVHGLEVEQGTTAQIEGHASGAATVEIWIDGVQQFNLDLSASGGALSTFSQGWTASDPGEHLIQVVALSGENDFSANDSTTVIVWGSADLPPEIPVPKGITSTPTPTLEDTAIDELLVSFLADPPTVQAGACTMLRWQVENAQSVLLGSTPMNLVGDYRVCLCEVQRYTLTVTSLEGETTSHPITIDVTGECVTPTPTLTPTPDVDTTGPSAPTSLSPSGGSVGCVGSVSLSWGSVSDPSGIAQYQVDAFRHAGDNNWSVAPGSVWTGISGTGMSMPVECGWTYRWRVRAMDGAGNPGLFSDWATFVVPLG